MVGHVAVDIYWGRCGRELVDISLLGTVWLIMVLKIFTGDGLVDYGAVDHYWGRCGR